MPKFIDVSEHQGDIDWKRVRAARVRAAYVRVADGTHNDVFYKRARVDALRGTGLRWGPYYYGHVANPANDERAARDEAKMAWDAAHDGGWNSTKDLQLAYDIEVADQQPWGKVASHIAGFVRAWEDLSGAVPIIYSSPAFLRAVYLAARDSERGVIARCPLWIAHIGVAVPTVPPPWKRYTIWQHSWKARIDGIATAGPTDVDVNRCHVKLDTLTVAALSPRTPKRPATRPTRVERTTATAERLPAVAKNAALRTLLTAKASSGRWDKRFCGYWDVPVPTNTKLREIIMKGYVRGLVPTATTNGNHAPGSYHYQGRAVDLGVRKEAIGTAWAQRRLIGMQRREFKRWKPLGYMELLGPDNAACVLGGQAAQLAEGTALEEAHDNHFHGAR
jgi:GH25 family lysozyme M1 (1,4-beta-N-acetylmuramidase)